MRSTASLTRLIGLIAAALLTFSFWSLSAAAADPETAFHVKRSVGLYDPFMRLLHSGTDNSLIPPYYEPWGPLHRLHVAEQLHAAGFDAVRLPVSPVPLMDLDETERQAVYKQVAIAIDDLLANGLNVVFDLHVISEFNPRAINNRTLTSGLEDPRFAKYLQVVASAARFAATYDPRRVAFEPFNEPPPPCDWRGAAPWPRYQKRLFDAARAAAPRTTLVLTGACWAGADALPTLNPADYDANTLYTLHFYDPTVYSAQGQIGSTPGQYLSRIPYPPTANKADDFITMLRNTVGATSLDPTSKAKAIQQGSKLLTDYFAEPQGPDAMARQLKGAADWARQNHISPDRIYVGEFGVVRDAYGRLGSAPEDRLRWLRDARTAFETLGFGWSVWSYAGQNGIIKGERMGPLDPAVLGALGLKGSE